MTEEGFEKWLEKEQVGLNVVGYPPSFVPADRVCALFAQLRAEQRWVPVAERLPEEPGYYLVLDASGENAIHEIKFLAPESGTYVERRKITHWMPLPPPPPLPETKEPHDS